MISTTGHDSYYRGRWMHRILFARAILFPDRSYQAHVYTLSFLIVNIGAFPLHSHTPALLLHLTACEASLLHIVHS